jgi:hypothetical protein
VVPQIQPAKNLPEGWCAHALTYTNNQDTLKTQKTWLTLGSTFFTENGDGK